MMHQWNSHTTTILAILWSVKKSSFFRPPYRCSYWGDHKDAQENQWRHKEKDIFLVKQHQGRLNNGNLDYTDLSQGKRRTGHTAILSQYNLPIYNDPRMRRFKSQSQKSLNTFVFNSLALALKHAWCWPDWERSSAWNTGSHPKFMTQPMNHN